MFQSRNASRYLVLGFCLALVASAASATTVLAVDAKESVDRADLIFVGQALDVRSAPTADQTLAYTFVTFAVGEELKGSALDETLTLRFEGGQLPNGDVVEVVGMPSFEVGESYLLFVDGNGEFACPLVGWWQGKLTFATHPDTGVEVLVDHRGAPVRGIESGLWQHGAERIGTDGSITRAAGSGVEVLWQDGVEILPEVETRTAEVLAAETILAKLRRIIERRSSLASFQPGVTVESALVSGVPASGALTADAPTR